MIDLSRSILGKEASWERVLITFEKYAIDFKKRYGSVPVLIIDNCDSLANKDPRMLEILQDTAKRAIDDSTWITVFVASVGNAPEQMEGLIIIRIPNPIEMNSLSFQVEVALHEHRHSFSFPN